MKTNLPELGSAHSGALGLLTRAIHASAISIPIDGEVPRRPMENRGAGTGARSLTGGWVRGRQAAEPRPTPLGGWHKRALDIVVASTALVAALPVMLIVALLIKTSMGGAVIFAHRRIGFNGRSFECYKFRTMVEDAEGALEAYLKSDPTAAREWMASRKLKHDPRITFLGQMLRKSSLDELPQLFNILRGDMSCVGPRPIVEDELQRYGPFAPDYLRTRPGLTGPWQVNGRSKVDYSRRISLDAEYIRNWSIWTDLKILFRTIFVVMRFDQAS